jgi:hypothetical protein
MRSARRLGVALLAALPVFSQSPALHAPQSLLRWSLEERPEQILRILGPPDHVDDTVKAYQSWQYENVANEDRDDNSPPSYILCLSTDGRGLISLARNFGSPQDVDSLFPPAETRVYHWSSKEGSSNEGSSNRAPQFSVRLRRLSEETLLIAMGTARPGERTTQLILIRQSALKLFMPWLSDQLTPKL